MRVVGIIAEYNPFHNGHAFQIAQAREQGATHVVVCMSGNFVQRGDGALFRKQARAEMAVLGGADLVVELPLWRALSSAEGFAFGGVQVLSALGAGMLCFGAEDDDTDSFRQLAQLLLWDDFFSLMRPFLAKGFSFPRARALAVENCAPALLPLVAKPNNLLGTEYAKAILRQKCDMKMCAIKRIGAEYHDDRQEGEFLSATAIRGALLTGNEAILATSVPEDVAEVIMRELSAGHVLDEMRRDIAVLSRLKAYQSAEAFHFFDNSEGFHNRLFAKMMSATSLQELYRTAKSKRYPESRVRRAVFQTVLSLHKEEPLSYIRILAMNDRGREILGKRSNKEILFSHSVKRIARQFGESARFTEERLATDFYHLFLRNPLPSARDETRIMP